MRRTKLILASTSTYRRQLLERLEVPFAVANPGIDETPINSESPEELVQRLANAKASAVAKLNPGAVVIGSDQVAVMDGKITGKPGTHGAAVQQLRMASGKEIVFLTGLCCYISNGVADTVLLDVVPFRVVFRHLRAEQIEGYLQREKPYDCAGSFKSEGLGVALFERMIGDDPSALMGLPLIKLTTMLEKVGISVI
ncbi:MAG: septum formation inhibitor Maf [Magnetococcales bacterium]|nr:septum formation inhibitor Maf [Magnetococcales bacterium]